MLLRTLEPIIEVTLSARDEWAALEWKLLEDKYPDKVCIVKISFKDHFLEGIVGY